MLYDIDYYRPSYYYRPRYFSSYSPTYYSSYYSPYYSPSYPSSYITSIRSPCRYNFDYDIDVPDYKYRYYTRVTPKISPVWSQADRYSFIHGLTFRETAADIRYSANKVLEDIRSPRRSVSVPRYTCASSLTSGGDSFDTELHKARRAVSRARGGEAPSYHNISKCIVY